MWTPELEAAFQRWFGTIAQPRGLANPDAYGQHYDYRGAWQGGAQPGLNNHWPSQYKYPEHPRTYINGYDTRTGGLAPMITNWLYEE